jgi:translation initiation factor 3 subunit B
MAPSFDQLPPEEDFDEDEIDYSDLREQFEVRLDEGLDTFVVIDGLPKVPDESKQKLVKFLLRKLNTVGKAKEEGVEMPMGEDGITEGYASVISTSYCPALTLLDSPSLSLHPPRRQLQFAKPSTERH